MTRGGERDRSLVRSGDAVERIAEVVHAKRRRSAVAAGRLDALSREGRGATIAALTVLSEVGVIDSGTGVRLLRRALSAGELDPCGDLRNSSEKP